MVNNNIYANCIDLCGFRSINIMFNWDAEACKFKSSGYLKKWLWQKKIKGCSYCITYVIYKQQ